MQHRSLLKWTVIAAVSIAITLLLLSLQQHDSVSAKTKTRSETRGSLQAITTDGKPVGECPLKHTDVKAEVSGFISRVTVTQEFENPYADKIEAVYVFPLPQNAAVDDLTMVIGDRTVKGKIMRREEAKAAYETAKSLGKMASLLDQEQPNVFTQSVANIMPGLPIKVTISYVETLKYTEGYYEFTFPMVVAPRYMADNRAPETADSLNLSTSEDVSDVTDVNPPRVGKGMRAGHDVSLEIAIDAGVPLEKISSRTHEVEIEKSDERRAVVRLKDQVAIPNKDFVLKYQVAGQKIEDAVLAHRSGKEGFFTLILQPPQRVAAEDVMPKELVFVMDTSGSMEGFPIEKAKETMDLALNNLYPHDMFNVITFSGDTEILFPEPVPATEENLRKAKRFLAKQKGQGGTEMMKAIRAALDPSDSQQHVRIACFMTDGQVGNDQEIISEVRKHPNARVFAMGFGDAPNRALLDKMTQYGRGDIEYVAHSGNTSAVARRFNERVRNPLLTDLSVEWDGLEVSDVYPKQIPDLFSVKPVILTGRYAKGGKGTIRLRGMMAGQKFVREIPVELPDLEKDHDVLGTLWARQKIDDLMEWEVVGQQAGELRSQPREEIARLGLEFKLMTQFTSFVAIDQVLFTPGGAPRRVDVPLETPDGAVDTSGPGGVSATVTVSAGGAAMTYDSALISTTMETRKIEDLPLQGRSVVTLATLAPGIVASGQSQSSLASTTNISVNGTRSTSNNYCLDGVSANYGIAPGGISPGISVAGTMPALTASGGANGLAAQSATEEVTIRTANIAPEFGRGSGGQISVITKSGSNQVHGSLFQYFGNSSADSSDWFANSRGLTQPPRRLNNFGGTLGGPIRKNQLFFFSAYEGLRLRQPQTALTDVPTLAARRTAPAGMQPFLDAFPLPNGAARAAGFAEFAASFSNPARHDVASLKVDYTITNKLRFSGHYNFADSAATQRGQGGLSLNTANNIRSRANALTGALSYTVSPHIVTEVRGNFSRLVVHGSYSVDDFGGAIVPTGSTASLFASELGSFNFNLNARGAALQTGNDVASTQRQFNVISATDMSYGKHTIKFGVDYRRLSPTIGLHTSEDSVLFSGMGQAQTGMAARLSKFTRPDSQHPIFGNLSLYAQDELKPSKHLTLNYGLRWELNPVPSNANGRNALAVPQVTDPAQLSLAPSGTALWRTTHGNFAPRASFAYQLSEKSGREIILRGGLGLFYDLGHDQTGEAYSDSYPFLVGRSVFNTTFPANLSAGAPPAGGPITVPFSAFDPALKLPYSWQWNLFIQRALGNSQTISAGYVGSTGRRLLRTQTLIGVNPDFEFLRLTTNGSRSDYHSLQVQFDRRFSRKLSALVAYTLSKALDNYSQDSASNVLLTSLKARSDRGPSDFDSRHALNGTVSYELPTVFLRGFSNRLSRHWIIDSIFQVRSARPVNVVYNSPTSFGFASLRPDLSTGVPLHLFDPAAAGGKVINPAAFVIPADGRQGTLGRNSLRGFALQQIDLSLRRSFKLSERFSLQLQVEAFNLLNHPNFADPLGSDTSLGSKFASTGALHPNATFGQSASLYGRSVLNGGGFGSFYSAGGPRELRFSAKLLF
jgi:hypothetical protein